MSKFLIFFLFFINTFTVNGWGFKKNNTHTTPSIGSFEKILEGTDSYYVGDTNEKVVYLTFDVGYDNGNLNDILDTLDKYNVRGTFFLTGDFVNRYHDLVIRLSLSNHLICNHSYGHKNITKLSKSELKEDLLKLEEAYYSVTNKRLSSYFRPPEGEFDNSSLKNVNDLGYTNVFWSVAWIDWLTNNQKGAKYSYDSYVNNLHPGAIVLMHTVSSSNNEALPKIIEYTLNLGYSFKTVDEIKKS